MKHKIIELAKIKLAEGKTEADLIRASEIFQKEFLEVQPGFITRYLTRTENSQYTDVVIWKDMDSAQAILEKAQSSEACATFFSVMEANHDDPSEGVSHFEILNTYAADNVKQVYCDVVIYSARKDQLANFEQLQSSVHRLLSEQKGFVGSFRGRNANDILKWNEEEKDAIAIEENGEKPDNIFIDYVFWRSLEEKQKAGEKIQNTPEFQAFSGNVETIHNIISGMPIDDGKYLIDNVCGQILEVAFYTLNKPFEEGMSDARPDIVRWLEHLRGYRGIITTNSSENNKNYSDIVLWKDLETAEYAANELYNHDHEKKFLDQFEAVALYGHFHITGVYGNVGITTGD